MNPIKLLRRRTGLTQDALAQLAGTSQPTIAAYESGRKSPTLTTAARLARATGLEMVVDFVPPLTREDRRSLALHDAVIDRIRDTVAGNPVYLTFDIDCLDPSYAPGTGTPVCGGLTSHQALSILRGLAGISIVGMDVVEVAPAYDTAEITSLAAASIAMEMLYLYASR